MLKLVLISDIILHFFFLCGDTLIIFVKKRNNVCMVYIVIYYAYIIMLKMCFIMNFNMIIVKAFQYLKIIRIYVK